MAKNRVVTLSLLIALLTLSGAAGTVLYGQASGVAGVRSPQTPNAVSVDPPTEALMNLVNSEVQSVNGSYPTPGQSTTPPTERTCGELAFDLQWVEQQIIGEAGSPQPEHFAGLLNFYWELYSTPHSISSSGHLENCLMNPGTSGTTSVAIVSVSLVVGSNTTKFGMALKNDGETPWSLDSITVGTVEVPTSSCSSQPANEVAPGQTYTCTHTTTEQSFKVGTTYPVVVRVASDDGVTASANGTVTAAGSVASGAVGVSILSASLTLKGSNATFTAVLKNAGNTTWAKEYVAVGATPGTNAQESVCQTSASTQVAPGQTYTCTSTSSSEHYTSGSSYPVMATVIDTSVATATAKATVVATGTTPPGLSAHVTGSLSAGTTSNYGVLTISVSNTGNVTITRMVIYPASSIASQTPLTFTVSIGPGESFSVSSSLRNVTAGQSYTFQVLLAAGNLSVTYTLTLVATSATGSASAQVTATASITAAVEKAANQGTFTCQTTAPSNYILLTNSGTAGVNVVSFSVTAGGTTKTVAVGGTACVLTASGGATPSEYIAITGLGFDAVQGASGVPYTGVVILSDGTQVSFSGTFH